jgi:hypothetical protein
MAHVAISAFTLRLQLLEEKPTFVLASPLPSVDDRLDA